MSDKPDLTKFDHIYLVLKQDEQNNITLEGEPQGILSVAQNLAVHSCANTPKTSTGPKFLVLKASVISYTELKPKTTDIKPNDT